MRATPSGSKPLWSVGWKEMIVGRLEDAEEALVILEKDRDLGL